MRRVVGIFLYGVLDGVMVETVMPTHRRLANTLREQIKNFACLLWVVPTQAFHSVPFFSLRHFINGFGNIVFKEYIRLRYHRNNYITETGSICISLLSITIPDSVTSIGNDAFSNCTSLTNVTIPDSVTSIGGTAFANCTSLTNISIPDSVTSIGESAFSYCTNLTNVTIPDSVTSIGDNTFYSCFNLTSVTLPLTLFMEENYSDYSLSTEQVRVKKASIDTFVANAESTARTAGQTDVTGDPATYSLYTSSELVTAEATARTLGQGDIINNPTIHGLFGENTVADVRIGTPMMRKNSEGKLLFDFQIQASDDLQNWTTLDTPEYEVIPSSDKEFLRVRVSNE